MLYPRDRRGSSPGVTGLRYQGVRLEAKSGQARVETKQIKTNNNTELFGKGTRETRN